MLKHKLGFRLLISLLFVALAWTGGVVRADSLQNVAESYKTTKPLQLGMVVQLDDKDHSTVEAATYNDSKKIFGVTVAPSATPVSLSSDSATQQAYIVTSGRYDVLVSDQNGKIEPGDLISISSVDGVAMKASDNQGTVLGRAADSFDGKNNVASTTSLTLNDGEKIKAAIGTIAVDVSIRSNPNFNGAGGVPSLIQGLATNIAGKPITTGQLYASMALLLVGLGVAAVLIFSGIQTSMAAIGRNPLAKQSIIHNMLQVIITALLIFIGCLVAVYLILKL